jgi:putative ABC transport system permease protein
MQAENAPFDATVEMQHVAPGEDGGLVPHAQLDVPGILKTQDVDLDSLAGSYAVLSQHKSPVSLTMRNPDGEPVNLEPRVMTLSDYNASLALQGKEPLALDEGSFALHTNKPKDALKDMLDAYLATEPSIEFGSATLRSSPSLLCTDIVETSSARAERVDIIVADTHVPATGDNALPVLRTLLNINYPQGSKNTTAFDGALTGTFYERGVRSTDDVVLNCWVETRTSVLQVGSSATTITAYIALYLGVVFLIASAALLAIAQLSEASDNVERYRMLSKIGTDEKMLRGTLLSQIAIYFGTPLVLALVHAFIGILALSETLAAIKGMQILSGSLIAALIVVAVYGGYFLATYLGSKSILNREVINRLAQE